MTIKNSIVFIPLLLLSLCSCSNKTNSESDDVHKWYDMNHGEASLLCDYYMRTMPQFFFNVTFLDDSIYHFYFFSQLDYRYEYETDIYVEIYDVFIDEPYKELKETFYVNYQIEESYVRIISFDKKVKKGETIYFFLRDDYSDMRNPMKIKTVYIDITADTFSLAPFLTPVVN